MLTRRSLAHLVGGAVLSAPALTRQAEAAANVVVPDLRPASTATHDKDPEYPSFLDKAWERFNANERLTGTLVPAAADLEALKSTSPIWRHIIQQQRVKKLKRQRELLHEAHRVFCRGGSVDPVALYKAVFG